MGTAPRTKGVARESVPARACLVAARNTAPTFLGNARGDRNYLPRLFVFSVSLFLSLLSLTISRRRGVGDGKIESSFSGR